MGQLLQVAAPLVLWPPLPNPPMITEARSPSIDQLHCLRRAVGVEPCWLLMGDRANRELGEVKKRLTSIEAGLQRSRLASCG
jgi:hypothetical protein